MGTKAPKQFEIAPEDYIWLSFIDIAVHKKFLLYYSFGLSVFVTVAVAIGCLTNWWQLLIIKMLTFIYVQNPIVGIPATLITLGIAYIWYNRRQKRIKRERAARAKAQRVRDIIEDAYKSVEGR